MIDVKDQGKLWDSILTLNNIDKEQAEVVFKAVIERSLRSIDMFTPVVSRIPLRLPDNEHIQKFKSLEKQIITHLTEKEEDKAYEFLVEYIEVLSELTESDSKIIQRRLIASLLKQHRTRGGDYRVKLKKASTPALTVSKEEDETNYYTPKEASKKLGVSDQTIRRMCDRGKFPGAYQTDGGHWKIPQHAFITTKEQDQKAEEVLQQIDSINKEVGGVVDEFDL